MSKRKRIGVDVDLVVAPSDLSWWEWLENRYECKVGLLTQYPYNLAECFRIPEHDDPMSYWNNLDYFTMEPIEGCKEELEKLSKEYDIVFISSCEGRHHKSKYYWLKQHFPFMEGCIYTKEKYLLNDSLAVMIDDRRDNLAKFDQHKRIFYNTPYRQTTKCAARVMEGWENGYEIIKWVIEEGERIEQSGTI